MNIKLSKTDFFYIFSVLFLFLLNNILRIQEPLSAQQLKRLRKKEGKGTLSPTQQAKLDAYRDKKRAQREAKQAKRDENVAERKEDAENAVQQRMEDETAYVKFVSEDDQKLHKDLAEYRRLSEEYEGKTRFSGMGKLYPHTAAQMIMFKPKFKMNDPEWYERRRSMGINEEGGNWHEASRIDLAATQKWDSVKKYNNDIEDKRIQYKLPTDESSDWEVSKVENTQKLIDFYPYAGKHQGDITIDGVADTTYNDNLRANDQIELKEQVVVKYDLANRPLAKTLWDDVADQFPMDVRDWEREEPGAFDPSLYMSKKERKKAKKIEKKQEKIDKKEEKEKKKKEEQEKEDAERASRSAPKDDAFIKFWKDLFNIKN